MFQRPFYSSILAHYYYYKVLWLILIGDLFFQSSEFINNNKIKYIIIVYLHHAKQQNIKTEIFLNLYNLEYFFNENKLLYSLNDPLYFTGACNKHNPRKRCLGSKNFVNYSQWSFEIYTGPIEKFHFYCVTQFQTYTLHIVRKKLKNKKYECFYVRGKNVWYKY